MNNQELLYLTLGMLISFVFSLSIYYLKKEKLIKKNVKIQIDTFNEDMTLQDKIEEFVNLNHDEFFEVVGKDVHIFFDPGLDGPNSNDREVLPYAIYEYFEEIADSIIEKVEYW